MKLTEEYAKRPIPSSVHDSLTRKKETHLPRRNFLAGSGALAAVGVSALFTNEPAKAGLGEGRCRPAAPRPIPGEDPLLAGLGLHLFLPISGREPSTIFDFHGQVAIVDLIGDGIRTLDGVPESAAFRADMRFMKGSYVGLDGKQHQNTFGFI